MELPKGVMAYGKIKMAGGKTVLTEEKEQNKRKAKKQVMV